MEVKMLNGNFCRMTKSVFTASLLCLVFCLACSKESSEETSKQSEPTTAVLKTETTSHEKPVVVDKTDPEEKTQKETEDNLIADPSKAPAQPVPVAANLAPLDIKLPKPMFVGTPQNFRVAKLEKPLGKPRPPFLAPAGTKNVAFKKSVVSTDDAPIIGEIAMITDGDRDAAEGSYVELGPFVQHVTVDLGARYNIYAVLLWHFHKQPRVYFDVIVQVADDPDFTANVKTIYNNDHDNSSGLGVGQDLHYVETSEGRLVDAKGVQARYVRLYSNGNTNNDLNHYIEVEVYGKGV